MARSEEAIRRRAEKRSRTEDEQREYDRKAMYEEAAKKKKKEASREHQQQQQQQQGEQQREIDPLQEPGAWECPGCGNHNFASRNWCNSKMCDEHRPSHISAPVKQRRPKATEGVWASEMPKRGSRAGASRHDPETSKVVVWTKQADSQTLEKNQQLRQRYQETEGEGMYEEDIERAKILIARDERKRQKKLKTTKNMDTVSEASVVVEGDSSSQTEPELAGEEVSRQPATTVSSKADAVVVDAKVQRKLNKKLRKRFLATQGEGMPPEDVERAKILIARDERKREKAAAAAALSLKGEGTSAEKQ